MNENKNRYESLSACSEGMETKRTEEKENLQIIRMLTESLEHIKAVRREIVSLELDESVSARMITALYATGFCLEGILSDM